MNMNSWLTLDELGYPHLEANQTALAKTQPQLAKRLDHLTAPPTLRFRRAAQGLFVCTEEKEDTALWIHDLDFLQKALPHLPAQIGQCYQQGKWMTLLMGLGLGYYLREATVYLETHHRGEPKGLLVMEADPGLFFSAFSLVNLADVIQTGRVMFAIGPNLHEELETLWRSHHLETLDWQQIAIQAGYPVRDPEQRENYHRVLQSIKRMHAQQREDYFRLLKSCELYWSKPPDSIRRVWTHLNDKRAAGGILNGLAEGFAQQGLASRALYLSDTLFTRFYRCAYDFYQTQPDLILGVNHSSSYLASFADEIPIPRLIWYVDHPRHTVELPFHPRDLIAGVANNFQNEIERRGGQWLGMVPVAASEPMTPPPREPQWQHEIAYVGSVIDQTQLWSQLDRKSLGWLEEIVAGKLANPLDDEPVSLQSVPGGVVKTLLPALQATQPKARYMTEERLLNYFLYAEANTRRRLAFIQALADVPGLALYGPPDWQRLLPVSLQSCYQGSIDDAEALGELYRCTKINLCINALQGFGFINPRVFDIPGQGGFVLAEWTPGIDEHFKAEEELHWFTNLEDLQEKTAQLLDNANARWLSIQKAQRRIQQEHLYSHRAAQLLDLVERKRNPQ